MIDIEAGETIGSEDDLYPNPAILIGGACGHWPDLRAVFAVAGRQPLRRRCERMLPDLVR
jgi:hypothetical protein